MNNPLPHPVSQRSARQSAARQRSAFTLVEVLLTMLLLGVILPVAMRGASLAMAVAEHTRHVSEASALAEWQLNSLITMDEWTNVTSGDFSPDNPQYRWNCQSTERDDGLTVIEFQVLWYEQGRERTFNLSTTVNQVTTTDTTGTTL